MLPQSRKIDLITKINPEVIKIINPDVFGNNDHRLGSAHGAVNNIIMKHANMLEVLLPKVINVSVKDPTWFKKVRNYWDSFGLVVPIGGKKFEIGFNFDFNDNTRKDNIKELVEIAEKDKKPIIDDKSLMDYVLTKIPESDKYKYAEPINVVDYLTWTFCLGHKEVANKGEFIEKSTNIRFVLIDPKDVEDTRRANHTISVDAIKKYLEVSPDRKKVRDILYIKGEDASKLDDLDADNKLKMFAESNPKAFLAIANNATLTVKARIERYCITGILKRLPSSSIIVDALDNGIVIGNTLDEAVAYFSSETPERVAKVKEFSTRYSQKEKSV